VLSFQRFVWPAGGVADAAPQSLGALPVACASASSALLPVSPGEAFWIGVSALAGRARIALAVAAFDRAGRTIDVMSGKTFVDDELATGTVPPLRRIDGIARDDGRHDVLGCAPESTGPSYARLTFWADADVVRARHRRTLPANVDIVDYATFARSGGVMPVPIDPRAGYKGYRLP